MLYVISGASRSGKTIIAKKLSIQKGIPYVSLDWIMMGFTNGIPEYGIHDKLFPDDIAQRLWSFLKAMFESMLSVETDCIIEGEAILPELIIELFKKYPDKLTICFMGYTDVSIDKKVKEIKDFSNEKNDWLEDKSDAYVIDHVKNMIAHSRQIEKSCKENRIRYFDTSKNFIKSIEDAIKYLSV
ncbi:hypothetical protein [Changchengzhania lutea]|uniref:hypothetical protein n=1 Tax=Changchengzhania lutea TaxID=2049305 RepID=UPI00115E9EDC|nr:hypothetical protein [Changchengzhania lutea]